MFLAEGSGLEPETTQSKCVVLPLHHPPTIKSLEQVNQKLAHASSGLQGIEPQSFLLTVKEVTDLNTKTNIWLHRQGSNLRPID